MPTGPQVAPSSRSVVHTVGRTGRAPAAIVMLSVAQVRHPDRPPARRRPARWRYLPPDPTDVYLVRSSRPAVLGPPSRFDSRRACPSDIADSRQGSGRDDSALLCAHRPGTRSRCRPAPHPTSGRWEAAIGVPLGIQPSGTGGVPRHTDPSARVDHTDDRPVAKWSAPTLTAHEQAVPGKLTVPPWIDDPRDAGTAVPAAAPSPRRSPPDAHR